MDNTDKVKDGEYLLQLVAKARDQHNHPFVTVLVSYRRAAGWVVVGVYNDPGCYGAPPAIRMPGAPASLRALLGDLFARGMYSLEHTRCDVVVQRCKGAVSYREECGS